MGVKRGNYHKITRLSKNLKLAKSNEHSLNKTLLILKDLGTFFLKKVEKNKILKTLKSHHLSKWNFVRKYFYLLAFKTNINFGNGKM
jgi:hypothetical protein